MHTRFIGLPLLGCLLFAPLTVDADSTAAPDDASAEPLTLDRAIEEAIEANYAVRQAEARVEVRRGELRHAGRWTTSNPVLEAEVAEREAATGATGNDFAIRLSQEFRIGGQGSLERDAADARLTASREDLRFLRSAVAARTRRAFLDVLLTERARVTAERLVTLTETLADNARSRLDAGRATALDMNTAMIGVARARNELVEAERRSSRARLVLAELLARDPAAELAVSGTIEPWPLALPGETELLNLSARRRGDLAAAAERVRAAQEELELSQRRLIPNLTVFGFYEEEEDNEITGVGVSLPLPFPHTYRGEREQAAGRLSEARLRASELRLVVRRQVLEAVVDYRAARQQADTLGRSMLERAEEDLELTRQAFDAGKVGSPAITAAQNNLIDVRRSYLDALGALIESVTELERATGGLVVLEPDAPPAR